MTHEYEPQSAKETAWQRLMLSLGLTRRNNTDERQAAAAEANRPHREREAATRAAMTGEQIAKAGAKALGRVGAK